MDSGREGRSVKDAIAIVTGSSGGTGTAISKALIEAGYWVWGLDQAEPSFENEYFHSELVDLSDMEQLTETLQNLPSKVGVVIHCAAEQPLVSAAGGGELAAWTKAYLVNVLALEHIVSIVKPDLESTLPHRVIAIGSVHETITSKGIAPYSVSKAALGAWIRAASLDLAGAGIAAISVSVGAIDSPKLKEGLERFPDPENARIRLIERLPAGRLVSADDVAQLCVFLLRPEAQHFTGTSIRFDGGVSAVLATE
jgi:NAD(P)-dependent dehydrogenase (short-subunit alcohol dehydrogenase family)